MITSNNLRIILSNVRLSNSLRRSLTVVSDNESKIHCYVRNKQPDMPAYHSTSSLLTNLTVYRILEYEKDINYY